MGLEPPVSHLSFSQLAKFAGCGLQYRFDYVEREQVDDYSLPTEAGTAVHRAIEEYETRRHNEAVYAGKQASLPSLVELAQHNLLSNPNVVKARMFGKQDLAWWLKTGIPGRCDSYLRWQEENAAEWGWYSTDPLSVEVPLKARWSADEYIAYADQIRRDRDGSVVIVDLKTGKAKATHALQLNLYMLALLGMDSDLRPRDVYGQVLYLGEKGASAQMVPLSMTVDGARTLAQGLASARLADVFPATGVFTDACKWCPHTSKCPLGSLSSDGVDVLV